MKWSNLLYTFQTGYGLVALPLQLLSFATTIYYLLINNIPFLKELFPRFEFFLVFGGLIGFPTIMLIGWLYLRSELNKASTRTHPFSLILVPTQLPLYDAVAKLCREKGLDAEAVEIENLVAESREKW